MTSDVLSVLEILILREIPGLVDRRAFSFKSGIEIETCGIKSEISNPNP